jgi:hypothetical protein
MTPEDEKRHLDEGPRPGEEAGGVGTITVRAACAGDAEDVIGRCREVLAPVIARQAAPWPADDEWSALLPSWFVRACVSEQSEGESAAWLARWQALSPDEQAREAETAEWSLLNWVEWFRPEMREWFWWDAAAESGDVAVVEVQIDGWPAPTGALKWLLRAAGAVDVAVQL